MSRQHWGRRIEFFLTSVGFSVGVGDLWRFPYLVMKNGGGVVPLDFGRRGYISPGVRSIASFIYDSSSLATAPLHIMARLFLVWSSIRITQMVPLLYIIAVTGTSAFLIPIAVFNVIGAMPIVYLEMIMGQYSQSGAIPVWNVCPLLKGAGYGASVATFIMSVYYAVIICWMLFYLIHSFYLSLPWTTCNNDWNIEETCVEQATDIYNETGTRSYTNSITNMSSVVATTVSNLTATNVSPVVKTTAAEQFWKYKALDLSDGLENMGSINWPMLGCLASIEIACYLCIFKGVKLSGKVVYITVPGPFVLLAVFLVRGAILPGADIGIKYYITPDLEKLKEPRIWAEACMQVFRSIGPGMGAMITFASYNKFNNNCMRDAILVCLLDLLTGFLGGFVVFSVIGHVSYRTGIDIQNFNQSGLGLGFIAYPEAANYLPPPQLWCALFFLMSVFLGIDSQFPLYEIVATAIKDEFPKIVKERTTLLTFVVILIAFVLAVPHVTEGGFYLLTLLDWYTATFPVSIIGLLELLTMTHIYGMNRIDDNMRQMLGRPVPLYFKICWLFVTPLLLTVMIGFTAYSYVPPVVSNYEYPSCAVGLRWSVSSASLVPIPIYMSYRLIKTPGSLYEKFRVNLRPNDKWGPQSTVQNDIGPVTLAADSKGFETL